MNVRECPSKAESFEGHSLSLAVIVKCELWTEDEIFHLTEQLRDVAAATAAAPSEQWHGRAACNLLLVWVSCSSANLPLLCTCLWLCVFMCARCFLLTCTLCVQSERRRHSCSATGRWTTRGHPARRQTGDRVKEQRLFSLCNAKTERNEKTESRWVSSDGCGLISRTLRDGCRQIGEPPVHAEVTWRGFKGEGVLRPDKEDQSQCVSSWDVVKTHPGSSLIKTSLLKIKR